jgi:hypothetical protein
MKVPPEINTNFAPIVGLVKLLSCAAASMTKDEAAIRTAIMIKKRIILFIFHFLGSLVPGLAWTEKLSYAAYECKYHNYEHPL